MELPGLEVLDKDSVKMFAANNLMLTKWVGIKLTATAANSNNVTINPATFVGYTAGISCLTYNIPANVVIGSTTSPAYALTVSGFNARDRININNSGKIVGKGGDGNNGAGGPALNVTCAVGIVYILNNSGAIIGGGGGAGGQGVATKLTWCDCGTNRDSFAAGGGGAGGQGYGGGLGGPPVGSNSNTSIPGSGGQFAQPGAPGGILSGGINTGSGGTSGVGTRGFASYLSPVTYFGPAGRGGNGGSFGSNGCVGSSNFTGIEGGQGPTAIICAAGAGGAAGNAIKGVGKFTLANAGNVYGPQIP
jgi:hypothetical protein